MSQEGLELGASDEKDVEDMQAPAFQGFAEKMIEDLLELCNPQQLPFGQDMQKLCPVEAGCKVKVSVPWALDTDGLPTPR